MPAKYTITIRSNLLKDQDSVKRHIAADDYFGTIATVLSLIKQEIKNGRQQPSGAIVKVLKNLETDLLFLQKNCHINYRPSQAITNIKNSSKRTPTQSRPTSKNMNKTPKGRLMSQ